MSKKQFIQLADYLRDTQGSCESFTPKQIEYLSNFCKERNQRFLRERFKGYIAGENGLNGGPK